MRKTWFILSVIPIIAGGQSYSRLMGSRSAGLAHSSVALADVWSVYHNQAGMTKLEATTIALSYEKRYFINDLNLGGLAVVHPVKKGAFGISTSFFGFSLYQHFEFGMAYAHALGEKLSAGVKVNYERQVFPETLEKRHRVSGELGFILEPLEKLNVAFHLSDPAASFRKTTSGQSSSSVLRLGASYQVSEKLLMTAEILKHLSYQERLRIGLEYRFAEAVESRVGLATKPLRHTLGIGFNLREWRINISFEYLSLPGPSSVASMQYSL